MDTAKAQEKATTESLHTILARIGTIAPEKSLTEAISGEESEFCEVHHSELPCSVCQLLEADRVKAKQAVVARLMPNAQIGKRYHNMTFPDYKPTCKESTEIKTRCVRYSETFKNRLENCDSILMLGKPGTGKNMLAACICRSIMEQGFTALHTTAIKLVRAIKGAWHKDSEQTEQEVINSFLIPDLLVIDEIGVQFGSDTEKLFLTEIVIDRHENMRPTILLSNLSLPEIETYIGLRAIDRFYEGDSAIMTFTWESWRRRK